MRLPEKIQCLLFLLLVVTSVSASAGGRNDRVHLFPQLQAGQSLRYLIRYRADRQVKTRSNMVAPMAPAVAPLDARGQLILEILDVQSAGAKSILHMRAHFQDATDASNEKDSTSVQNPPAPASLTAAETTFLEFTVLADGRVEKIKGLDDLSVDQQQSWQEWLSLFAAAGVFPANGVKPHDKWKSDVVENVPSPIADLHWEKESNYVNDQPCGSQQPKEICAVILTKSILKQKSSPKDATPEDFKLHQLRTLGTASGTNETITYISLQTGLVVRATEEAAQLMDVTVAKSDGSNGVHYTVDAKSHAEILLLPNPPPTP